MSRVNVTYTAASMQEVVDEFRKNALNAQNRAGRNTKFSHDAIRLRGEAFAWEQAARILERTVINRPCAAGRAAAPRSATLRRDE